MTGVLVDTGSPHFVVESADLKDLDVPAVGKEIRHDAAFAPIGCNVNFVSIIGDREVRIRTYERGVEAETLACGTGCVASAIVMAQSHNLASPVTLNVRSGEQLLVRFQQKDDGFSDIWLEGSAHVHFTGVLHYNSLFNRLADSFELLQTPIH
ncbi:MAG: hypothetical protein HY961_18525 [Ignavibacteriae bacterium]|nr:hypothetical protein [Ignavibacteriota bacterium]